MEAFVYVWVNSNNNKKYIGYHKGCEDDGYVCSSKNEEFWRDYNNNLLTRQIMYKGSSAECIELESSLIKNECNEKLYNRNINGKVIFTDDVKKKMSDAGKGRKQGPLWIKNRRESLKGRKGGFAGKKHSEETIKKMKTVVRTEEHKQVISNAIKGRPGTFTGKKHKKVVCQYCNKQVSINTFSRWHGDNCKENKWQT